MAVTQVVELKDTRGRKRREMLVQSVIRAGTLDDPHATLPGLGRWVLDTGETLNRNADDDSFTVVATGERVVRA